MFKINEVVTIKSIGADGIIKDIFGNKVKVAVKNSVIIVKNTDIYATGLIKKSKGKASFSKTKMKSKVIDLHGLHYQEAYDVLDLFFNDAITSNTKSLHIIHGSGNGVMKRVVNEIIELYKNLVAYHDYAPLNQGGIGATKVILK